MQNFLKIKGLSVSVEGRIVLEGINLLVKAGELHAVMGPNGSGKSSLALALMGHPDYVVTGGKAEMNGKDLLSLKTSERVKMGLFLSFQNPAAVAGVTLGQLLWSSYKNTTVGRVIDVRQYIAGVKKQAELLGIKAEMLERFVNDGFSGGEKKKAELLMILSCSPKFVILDEIDSGLDVDTLKKAANVINDLLRKRAGIILITHNRKILKFVKAGFVHVLKEGRIVKSGNLRLAGEIEEKGYAGI